MMKICVFNPEHDLALAANLSNFTAPHAGRQLRADLGYLPALWATDGDYVLVDNVEDAERRYRILMRRPFGRFLTKEMLHGHGYAFTSVDVWGFDQHRRFETIAGRSNTRFDIHRPTLRHERSQQFGRIEGEIQDRHSWRRRQHHRHQRFQVVSAVVHKVTSSVVGCELLHRMPAKQRVLVGMG